MASLAKPLTGTIGDLRCELRPPLSGSLAASLSSNLSTLAVVFYQLHHIFHIALVSRDTLTVGLGGNHFPLLNTLSAFASIFARSALESRPLCSISLARAFAFAA
jgi:hypothetical protein